MAVHREVAHLHVLLAHPQRHDECHELEEQERADAGEDDHEQRRQRLPLEQMQAARDGDARDDLHRGVGEQPGQKTADEPREAVGVDDAERVVDVAERPQEREVVVGDVDEHGGGGADRHGAPAVHETRPPE